MKRLLLATTALVAAGAFAGAAQADDMMGPIEVGVGGYYRIATGSYSADIDKGNHGQSIDQNIEINLAGETTLDNGITAGVNIWLDAMDGGDDDISETSVYFSGAFGTLKAGGYESAAQLGTVWAPGGNGNFGIKSPFFANGSRVSWRSIVIGDSEDSFKVSYDSPSFNGISLSASYEPDDSETSYSGRGAEDAGEISEVASVHLGFTQEVMGGSVSAGVGIENGTYEACKKNCDASSIRGGLVLSVDEFSIGGAMLESDGRLDDMKRTEQTDLDFGIGWSQGPLGLGIQHGTRDAAKGNNFEVTAFNASYDLGSGIQVNSQVAMGSTEMKDPDDASKYKDNDWMEFLIGTTITF